MNIIGDHLEEPDFEKEENKNPPSVHHPKITMNTLVSIHFFFCLLIYDVHCFNKKWNHDTYFYIICFF